MDAIKLLLQITLRCTQCVVGAIKHGGVFEDVDRYRMFSLISEFVRSHRGDPIYSISSDGIHSRNTHCVTALIRINQTDG